MQLRGQNIGIFLGLLGAVLGGLLWIIITGIVLKSAIFIVIPAVLMILSIVIVYLCYKKYPGKWLLILGILIIFLVAVNFIFANILYQSIPDSVGGITTGKNEMSLLQVNIFLGIFAFWGIFCIIIGTIRKHPGKL
jgi:drug/metabolite transporter (DMT)-like permease